MAKWQIKESDYPADFKFLYVSKDGNNANAGTQAAPLLEINAAILKAQADAGYEIGKVVIVIGSGLWAETLSTTRTKQYRFIGDGEVVFDGISPTPFQLRNMEQLKSVKLSGYNGLAILVTNQNSPSGGTLENITSDYDVMVLCSSFSSTNQRNVVLLNCIAQERIYLSSSDGSNFINVYVSNCVCKNMYYIGGQYYHKSFYNNTVRENFYVPSNTPALNWLNVQMYGPNSSNIDNNNLVGNNVYLISNGSLITGDMLSIGKSRGFEQNSFSAPPKFTNEAIGDYTLQPDSPNLRRGKDGANIGVYGRGYAYPPTAAEWLKANGAVFSESYVGGVLEDDIELNLDGFWQFKTGHKTGWVKSQIIDLGSDVKLNRANLIATMGFNAFTGKLNKTVDFECQDFGAYNNAKKYYRGDTCTASAVKYKCILDYPNENPFVEYPPATSPTYWEEMPVVVETSFQIDFEMRYGFTLSEINAATYKKILYNNPVRVDTTGKGNADDDFNVELAETIRTRFIQLIVKLKDLT